MDPRPGRPRVVLATHDPALAARAKRQVHLRDGRVERDEPGLEAWKRIQVPHDERRFPNPIVHA